MELRVYNIPIHLGEDKGYMNVEKKDTEIV